MHLVQPAPSQIQPFEQWEPTEAEVWSAQFFSQSLQVSSSDRPSKWRRREQYKYSPLPRLSSSSRASPSDRLALSTSSSSTAPAPLNGSGTHCHGPQPEIMLLDSNLWVMFNEHQNEMIITIPGRYVFPCLHFEALSLNPDAYYTFRLEFEMLAPNRIQFSNGAWEAVESLKNIDDSSAAADIAPSDNNGETYVHPDRLKLGSPWMTNRSRLPRPSSPRPSSPSLSLQSPRKSSSPRQNLSAPQTQGRLY